MKMRDVLNLLELSNNEIELYLNAFGKDLLTLEELKVLISEEKTEKLEGMIDSLVQKNLFIKIEPKFDEFIPRYYALPPFEAIYEIFKKNNLFASDEGQTLSHFKEDLKDFQGHLKGDVEGFQKAVGNSLNLVNPSEEISQILEESEENFKRLVKILLTKIKTSIETLKEQEQISKADLDGIISAIESTLSESGNIVSKVFDQLSDLINEIMHEVFRGEFSLDENVYEEFQGSINERVLSVFRNLISKSSESVDTIEESLQEVLKYYSLKNRVYIKDLWAINSHFVIKEEISRLKNNKDKEIKIIVPSIEKFLPLTSFGIESQDNLQEDIEEVDLLKSYLQGDRSKLKLISTNHFEHPLVKTLIKKNPHLEYRNVAKTNKIGILTENFLILGIYNDENDPLNSITGFGTTHKSLIDLLGQTIKNLWNRANPPKEVQITRGFNEILININSWKGNKIGERLEDILEIAFEEKGISLELIELKILLNNLNTKHKPLATSLKKEVISHIQELNEKLSPLPLDMPSELEPREEKREKKKEEIRIPESIEAVPPEEIEYEKLDTLFEMFIEKVDALEGKKISKQIDNFIEIVLKLQGHSSILDWRSQLNNVDDLLDEPFQEQIKADFLRWKKSILEPVEKEPKRKPESKRLVQEKKEISVSEEEEEYVSPGISQSQFQEEDDSEDRDSEESVGYHLNILEENIETLKGKEISEHLQESMDIILETKGYSMSMKDMKNWINRLKFSNAVLNDEEKEEFNELLEALRSKYLDESEKSKKAAKTSSQKPAEVDEIQTQEDSIEVKEGEEEKKLETHFKEIIEAAASAKGTQLSQKLLNVSDIILQKEGPMAARGMRNWISKLRTIREPLEEDIKDEFVSDVKNWKEKFSD
ncbi:MAG: hypothetical protein BAJALOKI2v1_600011 [Promethearchaeota archaeon]|nr:MAG: hypothetical protein BAJALOKI2v1_600011 [Candidatus Lokiarchaeota archaeon]